MQYRIIVQSRQGATDGTTGTKTEIDRWLRGWSDPENLSATVNALLPSGETGHEAGHKPYGRKTIIWLD